MAAHPSLVPGLGLEWTSQHLALTMTLVLRMMQSWVPQAALGWNAVAWAVSTEIAFYAAFPFLLRAPGRGLWLVGGVSWLASLFLTIAYVKIAPDHVVATSELCLPWLDALKFHPLARLPEFVAGVACGCWFGATVAAVVFALLVLRFVEEPARRWLR